VNHVIDGDTTDKVLVFIHYGC
ncbi:hypothetical protein D022_4403B, partial [Vibrio parahaemolyticus 12310]